MPPKQVPRPNESAIELVSIRCPVCAAAEHTKVCEIQDTTYGIPGVFQVAKCSGCGHLYLNPRPADRCLMLCYPETYAPYDEAPGPPARRLPDGPAQPASESDEPNRSLMRRALRRFPGLRSLLYWLGQENAIWLEPAPRPGVSRLLEIGCAHGSFLELASEAGWIADGVEPSSEACMAARDRGFEVFNGFLADADIEHGSRRAVVMWMVLEHVPDPKELLEEIVRILEPEGTLWFSVPNAKVWERYLFGRHWLGYDAPRHLQMFTPAILRRLLLSAGFEEPRFIHQANTRYWFGSIASWGMVRFPNAAWPQRWMKYFREEPPKAWQIALMLPGKLVAMLGCSGRITVIAKKRIDASEDWRV